MEDSTVTLAVARRRDGSFPAVVNVERGTLLEEGESSTGREKHLSRKRTQELEEGGSRSKKTIREKEKGINLVQGEIRQVLEGLERNGEGPREEDKKKKDSQLSALEQYARSPKGDHCIYDPV